MTGGDADLAAAVVAHPGARIAFRPDARSDLARAVGLTRAGPTAGTEVDLDALRVITTDGTRLAVNVLTLGTPPDRLRCWRAAGARQQRMLDDGRVTSIVVAVGQFLRGRDLVPRGHPGDGRAELQIYRVARREWPALRRRLATGTHLPHPAIETRSVRTYELTTRRPVPLEVDGVAAGRVTDLRIEVVPAAYTLLL